jgi:hypothetical protein
VAFYSRRRQNYLPAAEFISRCGTANPIAAPSRGRRIGVVLAQEPMAKTAENRMEPRLVMLTAAVIFGISALGGLVMAGIRFSGPNPPTALAMLHGFLSAAALTLLIYAAYTVGLPPLANVAVVLFVIAALGGVVMNLNYHWKLLPLPKWLMIVHASLAIVGYALLLAALWLPPPVAA